MLKNLFVLVVVTLLFFTKSSFSQCAGAEFGTLNPPPPAAGYTPGTIVTVCYTMDGWPGLNVGSNWLEGFDINLGSGWTNLVHFGPPGNCQGGGGQWVWVVNNFTLSGLIGPGWFFDSGINGPLNGNPADDWGDSGSCLWTFCFQVTVANVCASQNLLIQVTAGGDGDWGNWINGACPTNPYTIYNGSINNQLPGAFSISHN
jgi:hypothetical protein